jgi:hypothetical protein
LNVIVTLLKDFDMPVKCAVPTCSSSKGSRSLFKNRVSYFSTPKDPILLVEWESNLHLLDGQHLSSKSKICQLHFSESDIIKVKTVKKNGKDCFIQFKSTIFCSFFLELAMWGLRSSSRNLATF